MPLKPNPFALAALVWFAFILAVSDLAPNRLACAEEGKTALPSIFEDDFATFPLDRFKNTRGGELNWEMSKQLSIKEGVALVRPVQAGPTATLTMDLEFPALSKVGEKCETKIGLVLASRVIASAVLGREREASGADKASIRFLLETDRGESRVIRETPATSEFAAGKYSFVWRYGLLEVVHNDKPIAVACFETHHIPIVGVAWSQESGATTCRGMSLSGVAFPQPHAEQAKLTEASTWNEQGAASYRKKEYDAALEATKKGLAIYEAVLGDAHHDTANSLSNVAQVLQSVGRSEESLTYFDKALAIREKLMGPDHPDTALLNMQAAAELFKLGKPAQAQPYCLKAYFAFSTAYGDEFPATRTLQAMLDKLPKVEE